MFQSKDNSMRKVPAAALMSAGCCIALALAACQAGTLGAASSATTPPAPGATAPPSISASPAWTLSVSPGENDTYRIHVIDRTGREIQVLDDQDGKPPYTASELVKLDDYSGDGWPDILARGLSAGASALTSESIYVYDPKSGRFLDRELFENEGQVEKAGKGCIDVEHRNSDNMTYSKDRYCWAGHWVLQGSKR